MFETRNRLSILTAALILLAAFLIIAPAFAVSGDYGVATGASSQSGCGGTSGPSCVMSINGHSLSYQATNNDGTHSYQFDDYDCVAVVSSDGSYVLGGEECDQVTS